MPHRLTSPLPLALAAALAISLWAAPSPAQPRVVASVKPVHSLVAGVMAGVGQPALLVRGAASPHAYSLRPSDARLLNEAQVVFWVGAGLESFLLRPLERLGPDVRVVELIRAEDLALLPAREGGVWEAHPHESEGHPGPGHDARPGEEHATTHTRHLAEGTAAEHGHGAEGRDGFNAHIWLAPGNAQAMTRAIVQALSAADPAHADLYHANGARLLARVEALDADLRRRLAPVADRPYVVFHDAYAYLEAAYGLNAAGAIAVSPDRPPGARRVQELRHRVQALGAVCVFAEPQFQPRLVRTLVEGTRARTGILDPLGVDLPDGPEQYFQLMERLSAELVRCLSGA